MPSKSKAKQKKAEQQRTAASATSPSTSSSPSSSSSSSSSSSASSASPSPPVAASAPSSIDQLKDKGNKAFASGNYQRALDLYSQAIEEAQSIDTVDASSNGDSSPASLHPSRPLPSPSPPSSASTPVHTLFSNRSAAHLALKGFPAALEDAERCIRCAPSWPKGFLRKGQALEQLLRYHDALRAYKEGLALDPHDALLTKSSDELTALLDELKLSESELQTHTVNPDSDRFALMVDWLKAGGAQFPKLYLQYYSEDYRGVHSLAKIPPDDILLYVPFSLIMTSQVAMDSEVGQAIQQSKVELRSKHSYLASYLLQEKERGRASYWFPYLEALPAYYQNMPIFFPPSLLAMLRGSFTLAKIQDRIDSLKTEYDNIKAVVPSFARFSHDSFVWARLVVITRIFGLVIHGTKTDGLVPYADMLNHKKPRDASDTDTKWTFDDALDGFTIISLKMIQRGEQVYDSYGRKCNSRFFVNYGFALDDNEDDNEAVLHFAPSASHDPFYHTKLHMIPNAFTLDKDFQVPATYRETSDREKKTKEMFAYLRFVVAVDSELMTMGDGERVKVEDIEPVSVRNEREVLRMVKASAEAALAAFETTLEEDEEVLRSGKYEAYSNERNIVVMRRGEKQVLRWYVRLADTCIDLVHRKWSEVKKVTAKSFQSTAPLDHYITHVIVPLVKRAGG